MNSWRRIGIWSAVAIIAGALGGCAEQRNAAEDRSLSVRSDRLLARSASELRRETRARAAAAAAPSVPGAAEAGGKAPDAIVSAGNPSTTLANVLETAAKRSPMVEAARHRWLAATHRRAQAVALPDPKVEASYYLRQVNDKWMLRLSQEIPYPEKLILGGKVADKEARAAQLRYEAAVRDALSDAKEIYFELYYIDRAERVTEEIQKLYSRYAALAVGGSAPGAPKLPETFRAESQRAQLQYDLVLLREMRAAEAERLRSAIGAGMSTEIGSTDDVADPAGMAAPLEELQEAASRRNQELQAAGVEAERAHLQTKLARRAPIPDLMIGGVYERMNMNNDSQAGVMAGVSIPLWFPKYRAMAKEAVENEKAALAEQDGLALKVRADLARAYFSLNNSFRLVKLYRETLIPQARQALNSAEELYRKGQTTLSALLEMTATVHNFELARLRATADFYANIARLERVLGAPLQLGQPGENAAVPPAASEAGKGDGQ